MDNNFLTSIIKDNRAKFLNFLSKTNDFIQLFIENKNSISEENSIKIPLFQTTEIQSFDFDLTDIKNIKNFRLDPLNDSCVIYIEKLYLKLEDDRNIDLIPYIKSNACSQHCKNYFFDSYDPQIYFENINFQIYNISKFHIKLKYNHISKDAVHVCVNRILDESEKANQELWERVNNSEKSLNESEKANQELWERVNNSEKKLLRIYENTLFKLIKRFIKI